MSKSITGFGAFALGLFCSSIAFGQPQQPARFSRDFCVKVRDGKAQEFAAYLRDVTVKLAKVRVEAGAIASFTIAQAVAPAGRPVAITISCPPTSASRRRRLALSRQPQI